jgi:hypothetical protein
MRARRTAGWADHLGVLGGRSPYETCGLKVVRPSAAGALPARIRPAFALVAPITPVSGGDSVHEPVHGSRRPSADASYIMLLNVPKADALGPDAFVSRRCVAGLRRRRALADCPALTVMIKSLSHRGPRMSRTRPRNRLIGVSLLVKVARATMTRAVSPRTTIPKITGHSTGPSRVATAEVTTVPPILPGSFTG